MKKILVIMTNGVEELELIAPIDLCKRAGIEITLTALDDTSVVSAHGVVIANLVEFNANEIKGYDALFIPGGPHYAKLKKDERVLNTIRQFYNDGKFIFGICAAPTIFGEMGLLKNKKYTCFTSMNDDFGGEYVDTHSVIDLPLVTARSATAAIEFGFNIIKVMLGEEVVSAVKKAIYY